MILLNYTIFLFSHLQSLFLNYVNFFYWHLVYCPLILAKLQVPNKNQHIYRMNTNVTKQACIQRCTNITGVIHTKTPGFSSERTKHIPLEFSYQLDILQILTTLLFSFLFITNNVIFSIFACAPPMMATTSTNIHNKEKGR